MGNLVPSHQCSDRSHYEGCTWKKWRRKKAHKKSKTTERSELVVSLYHSGLSMCTYTLVCQQRVLVEREYKRKVQQVSIIKMIWKCCCSFQADNVGNNTSKSSNKYTVVTWEYKRDINNFYHIVTVPLIVTYSSRSKLSKELLHRFKIQEYMAATKSRQRWYSDMDTHICISWLTDAF